MKDWAYQTRSKVIAIVLILGLALLTAASIFGIILLVDSGAYERNLVGFEDSVIYRSQANRHAETVYHWYLYSYLERDHDEYAAYQDELYRSQYSAENSNFLFAVKNEAGEVLFSNHQQAVSYGGYWSTYDGEQQITVWSGLRDPLTANDAFSSGQKLFNLCYTLRYALFVFAGVGLLLAAVLGIYLLRAAGRRPGSSAVTLNWQDKLPLDLYLLVMAGIFALLISLTGELFYWDFSLSFFLLLSLCGLALLAVFMAVVLSCASRLKAGGWWKNSIIYQLLRLIGKACRGILRLVMEILHQLPLLWKVILGAGGLLLLMFIFCFLFLNGYNSGFWFLVLFCFCAAVIILLCLITMQLNRLKRGGEMLAQGDLSHQIDTERMFWEFKKHADNLNSISQGMAHAVEARMKSEHLKTELITNVSHDIKTPLTSIINYVDLLKKEEINDETARGYLEVLDRQSARLKKLTEDLVEASKASTGNITINPAPTDIVELLNQSLGEYSERFAANGLEPVLHVPDHEVILLVDGRLLWRVFDNLLNNICKYSQQGTRVYLHIWERAEQVVITFKNISRDILNISSEELMERFIRGDSARSSEGSGLGLSIARSLTELQEGSFELLVDGDLFKAVLSFAKQPANYFSENAETMEPNA